MLRVNWKQCIRPEPVKAVLSSLSVVGDGMMLGQEKEALGYTVFAVKNPHHPSSSLAQKNGLFPDKSKLVKSCNGFLT